jgi:hypothetical protein
VRLGLKTLPQQRLRLGLGEKGDDIVQLEFVHGAPKIVTATSPTRAQAAASSKARVDLQYAARTHD